MTKYRKQVLGGEIGRCVRDLDREVCRTQGVEILEGAVGLDYVHIQVSCPPNLSPSKLIQYDKGKRSRKLLAEFKPLEKRYWGRQIWACVYVVASSGNVADDAIMAYIQGQEGTEPGDGGESLGAQAVSGRATVHSSRPRTYRLQPVVIQFFSR